MHRIVRYGLVVVSAFSDNREFRPAAAAVQPHNAENIDTDKENETVVDAEDASIDGKADTAAIDGKSSIDGKAAQQTTDASTDADVPAANNTDVNMQLLGQEYRDRDGRKYILQQKGVSCSMFTAGHVFTALTESGTFTYDKKLAEELKIFGRMCQKPFGMMPKMFTDFMAIHKVTLKFEAQQRDVIDALNKGDPIVALYRAQNIYNHQSYYHYAMVQKKTVQKTHRKGQAASPKEDTFVIYNHMSSLKDGKFVLQHTMFNMDALKQILFHAPDDVQAYFGHTFQGNLKLPMFAIPAVIPTIPAK